MKKQPSVSYLILAYREPQLLGRLTRWLSTSSSPMFVHVDSAVDAGPFIANAHPSAEFVKRRFLCPWGTWGRVGATLEMLEAAVAIGSKYIALLSEDSFPIWHPREISEMLEETSAHIWMEIEIMGGQSKPLSRLSRRSYFRGDPRNQSLAIRLINRLPLTYAKVDWQKALGDFTPQAGDSWWILPREAAVAVLDFVRSNPATVDFFSRTWIPDEHFFQTVISNTLPEAVFRGSPMFADWTSGRSPHPPFMLDASSQRDLLVARKSHFFARKLEKFEPQMGSIIEKIWEGNP